MALLFGTGGRSIKQYSPESQQSPTPPPSSQQNFPFGQQPLSQQVSVGAQQWSGRLEQHVHPVGQHALEWHPW
jgi:hypothetical protein